MSDRTEVLIQPADLFKMASIKNMEDAEKALSVLTSFLLHMNPGDILKTSEIKFEKIDPNLIYINSTTHSRQVVDELVKKKVIKLPI